MSLSRISSATLTVTFDDPCAVSVAPAPGRPPVKIFPTEATVHLVSTAEGLRADNVVTVRGYFAPSARLVGSASGTACMIPHRAVAPVLPEEIAGPIAKMISGLPSVVMG